MRKTRNARPSAPRSAAAKKDYSPPRLVQYGSILKLTQAAGSGNGDTGMVMMATCL